MHKCNLMDKINQLPDLASTNDLIRLGLFTSISQATHCRKRGDCPVFMTLSKKRIVYTREAIIDWLEKRINCVEV